ncbi:MAG: response regulator [Nitrospirae bacterium]|nr:response regulator [Candidatus Troglogloeales bacterium]
MMTIAATKILVVDDPADAKATLRALHTFHGTTPVSVESVDRLSLALEYLQKNKADIILTDMRLPDSSGLETLTRLLKQSPDVPIVVMTGAPMEDALALDLVRHGAQDYLFKDKLDGEILMRVIHFAIERKRAEVALHNMTLELKRSNDDLMQFAYTAAHDLKQPLHNIIGFIRILEDRHKGRLDKESAHDILQIVRSVKRMGAVIDDLLLYAKAGSTGLNMQQVSLEDALQIVLENLHQEIGENDAVIMHDALPTHPCDEPQVVCLLQNLLDNAIKFNDHKKTPRIEILAETRGTEVVFSVRDNGIGIDPKYHEKIFVIFERLHTQAEYPGTGIGLAICKKIVERHKGRIWVESRLGEGSTFHFTWAQPNSSL